MTVPVWDRAGFVAWRKSLSVAQRDMKDSIWQAREAATVHLDAVLKVNGAKYLRLSHLYESLRNRGYALGQDVKLEAGAGQEPKLWLDLGHVMTMEPDAKTYRLSLYGNNNVDVLLETDNLEEAGAAVIDVSAHGVVAAGRGALAANRVNAWSFATLLYVWLTGLITGVAALALLVIILKKIPF
jgi:hypothetical protein